MTNLSPISFSITELTEKAKAIVPDIEISMHFEDEMCITLKLTCSSPWGKLKYYVGTSLDQILTSNYNVIEEGVLLRATQMEEALKPMEPVVWKTISLTGMP